MGGTLSQERLLAIIATQNEVVATGLDLDAVMSLVVERARTLTDADASIIVMSEGQDMVFHVASGTAEPHVGLRLPAEGSLSGRSLRRGEVLNCRDAESDARVERDAARRIGATSMMCVPLSYNDLPVAVLTVYDAEPNAFGEEDEQTLTLLSGVIAAHMRHSTEFEQQRRQSLLDSLTGLPNRRAFDERLNAEVARVARHGGEFALCLLDLDAFKLVNDTHGHGVGDDLLRGIASHLTGVRGEDCAFRFGGDEFAIVFVGADAAGAEFAMRRLERAVAGDEVCRQIGLSWGVAGYQRSMSAAQVLEAADAALYRAKGATGPPPEPARRGF